jgi:hypothetical protein
LVRTPSSSFDLCKPCSKLCPLGPFMAAPASFLAVGHGGLPRQLRLRPDALSLPPWSNLSRLDSIGRSWMENTPSGLFFLKSPRVSLFSNVRSSAEWKFKFCELFYFKNSLSNLQICHCVQMVIKSTF